MKFVDLFAGLGGFHKALHSLGHHCVFASELNPELAELYEKNFGIRPHGDIRHCFEQIPDHDILCAGFPCQPFSKAGEQLGFECPQWGDLFGFMLKILEKCQPRFLIIENVPNILKHRGGQTWSTIEARLQNAGYKVDKRVLSPHMYGTPQRRDRAIILGERGRNVDFSWPEPTHQMGDLSITDILDVEPADAKPISDAAINYIETWQALIDALPADEPLPSFPIWGMEFGANYPIESNTPITHGLERLSEFKGALGRPLTGLSRAETLNALPPYARSYSASFPSWKIGYIRQNRNFYAKHKNVIDAWLPQISSFAPSFQKLEWNWKGGPRNLWQSVIQFRSSGIRAKRPATAPSLVALTTSQVPVIAWERRFMTPRECARLQSMEDIEHLPTGYGAAYKALGNAVNVRVITAVARELLKERDIKEYEFASAQLEEV